MLQTNKRKNPVFELFAKNHPPKITIYIYGNRDSDDRGSTEHPMY